MSNQAEPLTEQAINELLVRYTKERNTGAASVIKMIKTKIATEKGRLKNVRELPPADILKTIQKEMKEIQETIESLRKAGLADRLAQEEAKLEILRGILPPDLSDEEIHRIVQDVVRDVGKGNFGTVMKAVMSRVAGRADGKRVSEMVKKALA